MRPCKKDSFLLGGKNMELKETLIMPKGTFEMRGNLPTKEPVYLKRWQEMDLYNEVLKKNEGHDAFYLHDGPPYANNDIHAGHALNKIVKDMIIRYKALKGFYTPFTPGWDTHGLPIENAVSKNGADRRKMSTVDFRNLCMKYALKEVEKQKSQMVRLGLIGDFNNPYITLKPEYEKAQIQVFASMALQGYIYRGLKPVNWSWSSESALAEAEIEYQDVEATTIYVAFKSLDEKDPIKKGDSFIIWTTTPWTIPANLAVCLNPKMEYGIYETKFGRIILATKLAGEFFKKVNIENIEPVEKFVGQDAEYINLKHPLYDRTSLVIVGDHVTDDAGTGCVHTAPGHGQDDYKVCLKYDIKPFCPVDDHGKMMEEAGPRLAGKFYEEANDIVLNMLKEVGALLYSEKIVHSYPHDWRTHKPLIFRATTQWFASLKPFKNELLKAVDEMEFKPSWGKKRLSQMIENRDDWCISRQRVWGVPIPIIYCEDGTPIVEKEVFDHIADIIGEKGSAAWFELSEKELLPEGYTNSHSPNGIYTKEKDIMDVWFDSGSSFLSVDKNRNRPFPADLYLEGNDQYRGWYNSSLILSIATTGIKPCKKIITHGMMVDANGEKFSKSKGNGVDPNKICSTYGADIFRFWVASVDFTQETRLSEDLIKICSENYRKIRNTFKFMLANLYDSKDEFADLTGNIELGMVDKLILNELGLVVKNVDKAYNNCDFNIACSTILNFVVNDLSAFYLKIAKDFLYCERKDSKLRKAIQYTMLKITKDLAIMLSPIIPFTTDEVNDHLPPYAKIEKNIALGDFPIEEFDAKLHEEYLTLNNIMKKVKVEVESLVQSKEINSFSEAEVDYKPEENEKEVINNLGEAELARCLSITAIHLSDKIASYKTSKHRCDRCWNFVDDIHEHGEDHLCSRCLDIIENHE